MVSVLTGATLHSPDARVNGAGPCIHDFVAARQRMLHAWQRLQGRLPGDVLAEEERATTSAMRQLRLLEEGACHEPR